MKFFVPFVFCTLVLIAPFLRCCAFQQNDEQNKAQVQELITGLDDASVVPGDFLKIWNHINKIRRNFVFDASFIAEEPKTELAQTYNGYYREALKTVEEMFYLKYAGVSKKVFLDGGDEYYARLSESMQSVVDAWRLEVSVSSDLQKKIEKALSRKPLPAHAHFNARQYLMFFGGACALGFLFLNWDFNRKKTTADELPATNIKN